MKTSLKFLSLFFAASLPGALAAEFVGVNLPAGLDFASAFDAFVIALVLLTAFADYSRTRRVVATAVPVERRADKAAHPLAA